MTGSGVHSFRFEAVYDCPVSHMLAITREFDLLATWNKMALDPAILGEPSIFANIVYTGALCRDGSVHNLLLDCISDSPGRVITW